MGITLVYLRGNVNHSEYSTQAKQIAYSLMSLRGTHYRRIHMSLLSDQMRNYQTGNYKLEIFTRDDKSYNFDKEWSINEADGISWAVHNDKNSKITYVNLSEATSFVISK